MDEWVLLLGSAGVFTTLGSIIAVILQRRTTPYSAMQERVVYLEQQDRARERELEDLRSQLKRLDGELKAERAASATAQAAHQVKQTYLLAHIDKLTGLLAENAPEVPIPPLTTW